jgi:hypothetical protein
VDGVASANSPGKVGIVTLNGKSLLQPFGTVSLAKVRVKPLVAAGERVNLSIQVRSLLRQNNTAFPSSQGFSGEILVTSASNSPTLSSTSNASTALSAEDVAGRARTFRRPGLAVELLEFETRNGAVIVNTRQVVVPDSAAPAEAAPVKRPKPWH